MGRKRADTQTKAVHSLLQRGEHLISEADPAQLFSDLFDRVHLRGIWGKEEQFDVVRQTKGVGLMTGGAAAVRQTERKPGALAREPGFRFCSGCSRIPPDRLRSARWYFLPGRLRLGGLLRRQGLPQGLGQLVRAAGGAVPAGDALSIPMAFSAGIPATSSHTAACWLHHPLAPKVDMPELKGAAL